MQTPVHLTTIIQVVKEAGMIIGGEKSFREKERAVDGEKDLLTLWATGNVYRKTVVTVLG